MITDWISVKKRNIPILLILILGLVLGFILFQHYGASWDEPEYYEYADRTLSAYSLVDRLAGTYQWNNTLGPADLRYYGPAFLIIGEGVHALLQVILPAARSIDLWHLTTYFSFLLGVFFFYKLAQRWTSTLAATLSTLLFASQPVIFGNAWLNPKDIPFMVFFMGAIYFGLVFSDHSKRAFASLDGRHADTHASSSQKWQVKAKSQKVARLICYVLMLSDVIFLIFSQNIRELISNRILAVNIQQPQNIFDQLFSYLAANRNQIQLQLYANKSTAIINRNLGIFTALTVLWMIVTLLLLYDVHFFGDLLKKTRGFAAELNQAYHSYFNKWGLVLSFLAACLFLGFASATRVLGPFAAVIIILVWIMNLRKKAIPFILIYALLSFLIFYVCWPFMWHHTAQNLWETIQHMSSFPVGMNVMFKGTIWDSRALPAEYLPTLLLFTLTIPGIILCLSGVGINLVSLIKKKTSYSDAWLVIVWFFLVFAYVVITTPPEYDNYRHFLFILPAFFLFSAFAIQFLIEKLNPHWLAALLVTALIIPGGLAIVRYHPYEYAYFNPLAGGLKGAAHQYEVDYWLTCYKELTEDVARHEKEPIDIYVDLAPDLPAYYASPALTIHDAKEGSFQKGSLIFLPLRWEHETLYPDDPIVYSVQMGGVDLCVAKKVQ